MNARTLTAATTLVLTACGGGPAGSAPAPAPTPTPTSSAPAPVVPVTKDLATMVQAALDAAALKTGRARSALEVVSSEAVVWSDGSLGCAEPGMNYTMALVPGYRITIRAGGELLDYHASDRGQLMLCPPGRSAAPSPVGTT